MGASNFEIKVKSETAKEAYSIAVSEAKRMFGNDSYNGTISTTNGFANVTKAFQASGKTLNQFMDEILFDEENSYSIQKWEKAGCI